MPSSTGSTASRCDGLATSDTAMVCWSSAVVNLPSMPRWYFTSPEPCAIFGSRWPSNSLKIFSYGLPTMLASTLSRPRWAMPMTTSSSPCVGRVAEHLVEQRDQRLAALQREPALADVLGLQERLERLGRVEPAEDVLLLARRTASRTCARPAPGSSGAPPGPGCACTPRRPGGSTSRAARRARRAASSSAGRRSRRPGTSRSRSHSVRPCSSTSRSGCRRMWNSSGSVSAIR